MLGVVPTHRDFPDSHFDGDPMPRFLREQSVAQRHDTARRSPEFDALPDYRPSPQRKVSSKLALAVIISAVLTYSHVLHF